MAEAKRVPDYAVTVDGKELTNDDKLNLQVIQVDLRRQAPASLELQFDNQDGTYDGRPEFGPGKEVSVKLGYTTGQTPKPVFKGETIGTTVKLAQNGPRFFVMRAFDFLHRLTRGRKTRTFLEQKFSEIVGQVCTDHGLTADSDDTKFKRDYVIQHNQTDLDFIRGIAGWLDYDLHIRHDSGSSNSLRFKKPEVSGSAVLTAVYEQPNVNSDTEVFLRKFDARQSLSRVVSEVVVRGWNPGQKKEIVGRATSSDVYGSMGGGSSGAGAVSQAWGETERQIVDYKVFTQEEADEIAKTKINEYARAFLRADIEIQGDPRLHPGMIIAIKRAGSKLDGDYFIEQATHTFSSKVQQSGGYVTRVIASRCGW
ncbi:MAG: contractile injection system protein, VgrG/Pvc8 family [bacterium]|nr:phage late control D family protein [Myxococcales bacterium]MCB9551233.1 phage late control D family protein [Myxococcales bacterium]